MYLTALIFLPIFVAILVWVLSTKLEKLFPTITIATTVVQCLIATMVYFQLDIGENSPAGVVSESNFQLVEKYDWIRFQLSENSGWLSVQYFLGVDGLNSTMVMLTALVMLIGAIASLEIKEKKRGYFALYLLLSGTIMGSFLALDFFLFYLFFEFMLLPMYFLIGIWGGARREYASIKFFLYTLLGSIFILMAMIGLYVSVIDPVATANEAGITVQVVLNQISEGTLAAQHQVKTFNILAMMQMENYLPDALLNVGNSITVFGLPIRNLAFILIFIGFAIKLPSVPFHTWLPDAHVEAPTPISVVLAGILLKIGGYGLLRFGFGIFPDVAQQYTWGIGLLGVISIVYAAYVALGTHNLKKLIAYSSVSHMGFVLLGFAALTPEGVNGAIYQMFSHGVISSMLFLVAGVIYSRTHYLEIEGYKGLGSQMPFYTSMVTIAFFASLGLPGFSGFIAELFVFLGAFASDHLPLWMPVVATLGLILGAAYYLWTLQRMFLGKFSVKHTEHIALLKDLTLREKLLLIPLALMTLLFGVFPHLVLDMTNESVKTFVEFVVGS